MSDEEGTSEGFRRGSRLKKLSQKAQEAAKNSKIYLESKHTSRFAEEDEDAEIEEMDIDKPQALFEGEDIEGKKMFSFQTPRKRNSLMQKVTESITPNVQKRLVSTPSHSVKSKDDTKTPYRNQLKRELAARFKAAQNSDEEPEEFEDSGSDFQLSDQDATSSEQEDEEESESESGSSDSEVLKSKRNKAKIIESKEESDDEPSNQEEIQMSDSESSKLRRSRRAIKQPKKYENQSPTKRGRKQDINYYMKTDEYFTHAASKKIVTSNHTLDKLETPRLPQDQLQNLLAKLKLSTSHQEAINSLSELNESYFEKWLLLLNEGFSVLLYGLGSKRNIVQNFVSEMIPECPTIVVNGFFPSLSIKDVLDTIMDYLELKERSTNPFEACNMIVEEFESESNIRLYLIVHNIDGAMLRNSRSQKILAKLASVKNIYLLATIDHINTPLLWDHSKISKFNFSWWDVTSFMPYTLETSYESSMMVKRSGNLALSSLNNVFLSLTSNSKGIYLVIVKKQLENKNVQHYPGLLFKDLYWACREAFLVSSDLALRAQLTEFVDHKMVKIKRSVDGGEYLCIPIDNNLLQKFLEEQSKT